MLERTSARSRGPPLSYAFVRASPRRRSMSNDIERELNYQIPRKSSVSSDSDSSPTTTTTTKKRSRVRDLKKIFEDFAKTNQRSNDVEPPGSFHRVGSLGHVQSNIKPEIIPKQLTSSSSSPAITSTKSKTKPSEHNVKYSSNEKNSNNVENSTTSNPIQSDDSPDPPTLINSITVPGNLMATSLPEYRSRTGTFINCQFHDTIHSRTEDQDPPNTSDISSIDEKENIDKAHKSGGVREVIKEVHATEQTYVRKLYILSIKLPSQIRNTCEKDEIVLKLFDNTYKPLLDALKRLYEFHHQIILPNLEQYVVEHRKDNMWSIFEEHYQTIEDLYKAYYVAYDENQTKLDVICKSNVSIHNAMLICQADFDNLYPINELNCANQRLLRYILLMKSYMKLLDDKSSEYEHVRFIHDELIRIAERCEEHLAVSSAQLNKLKERVDTKPECFDNQQLIWHGSLKKQSPRKRLDIAQRYVILFSNCILVYKESGNKLEFKRQLSVKDITIDIMESRPLEPLNSSSVSGQSMNMINTYPFRVNAVEKSYEFLADKEVDREKWVNKIRKTNEELRETSGISMRQYPARRPVEHQLGLRAPAWINDIDVSRCQICHNRFRAKLIHSRRHHCRSCGRCICGSCSTRKLSLEFSNKDGEQRVCDACYTHFTGFKKPISTPIKITRNPNKTILFGDFYHISQHTTIWIDLTEDFQLDIYAAKLDQVADYSINLSELQDISLIKETQMIVLVIGKEKLKLSLELNHQLNYQKNDYIDENMKNENNKTLYYANLWFDTMRLARLRTLPPWYIRKRESADSGISDNT